MVISNTCISLLFLTSITSNTRELSYSSSIDGTLSRYEEYPKRTKHSADCFCRRGAIPMPGFARAQLGLRAGTAPMVEELTVDYKKLPEWLLARRAVPENYAQLLQGVSLKVRPPCWIDHHGERSRLHLSQVSSYCSSSLRLLAGQIWVYPRLYKCFKHDLSK